MRGISQEITVKDGFYHHTPYIVSCLHVATCPNQKCRVQSHLLSMTNFETNTDDFPLTQASTNLNSFPCRIRLTESVLHKNIHCTIYNLFIIDDLNDCIVLSCN